MNLTRNWYLEYTENSQFNNKKTNKPIKMGKEWALFSLNKK